MAPTIQYFIDHNNDPLVLGSVGVVLLMAIQTRYLGLNLFLYFLFYKIAGTAFERYHVQGRERYLSRQLRQETKAGLSANIVFAVVGVFCHWLIFAGYAQIETEVSAVNGWLLYGSPILLLLMFDTYFYWVHFYLHTPKAFRRWHALHHRFKNPLPMSDLALHPVEAFLYVAFIPIALVLVPMHVSGLITLVIGLTLGNILGHLGFEFTPRWLARSRVGKCITFMAFHNFHHSGVHGNFGFFFQFWDRVMNTVVPAYDDWLEVDGSTASRNKDEVAEDKISA